MKTFPTWHEAHAYAQDLANKSGLSVGIENLNNLALDKPTNINREPWNVRFIPSKGNRFGYDFHCEAVEPAVLR